MFNRLKKYPIIVHVVRSVRLLLGQTPEKLSQHFHISRQGQLIQDYMSSSSPKKLQIGAQGNSINGWLNADIEPKANHVVYMDATKTFPFGDNTLDYVFAEHMIEHIPYGDADFMIKECFRVLKPQGKIRIATPNLMGAIQVLQNPDTPEHKEYIDHYYNLFIDQGVPRDPAFVVNKLFYGFKHRFIHTEFTLTHLLETNGFNHVRKYEVGESNDPELTGVEQHMNEMGLVPNKVETIVIQAQKNG